MLTFSLALAAHAAECVCVKEAHPSAQKIEADRRQAYGEAAAVFTGKVVALNAYAVKLKPVKRWKGDDADEVVISTGAVPGPDGTPIPDDCDYNFRLGAEYLVYARGVAGKLRAYLCSALPIKDAAEEKKWLDAARRREASGRKRGG